MVALILDKGLVIDVFVRVSLVGIEILTIDARIVVASVDTYLRFAEATNRLDLYDKGGKTLPDIARESPSTPPDGQPKPSDPRPGRDRSAGGAGVARAVLTRRDRGGAHG